MPQQRPDKTFLIPVNGIDLAEHIRKAWQKGEYRPTEVHVPVCAVSHGVYSVPFVHYANAPAGQLGLLQGSIPKNMSIEEAAWSTISDAFKFVPPPKASRLHMRFLGYHDHVLPKGRRPEGFSKGKRYYYVTMDIDDLCIREKDISLQKDPNPVEALTPLIGLHQIRHALSFISDEGKRWACIEAVEAALQQRFDRDHMSARKSA